MPPHPARPGVSTLHKRYVQNDKLLDKTFAKLRTHFCHAVGVLKKGLYALVDATMRPSSLDQSSKGKYNISFHVSSTPRLSNIVA